MLLCHPKGEWGVEMAPGNWREVSVSGEMFALRSSRSARQRGKTVRDLSFSTYAKLSEKLAFLTPWYAHVDVRAYQVVRNSFSEKFACVLNL